MRRIAWFTFGAIVGIAVYRRGQELADDARTQGIVPTIQQTVAGAMTAVATAKGLIAGQEGVRSWTQQKSEVAS